MFSQMIHGRRTEAPPVLTSNSIDLTGASRADLAVRCTSDPTLQVGTVAVAKPFADPSLSANTQVGPWDGGAIYHLQVQGNCGAFEDGESQRVRPPFSASETGP